MRMNPTLLAALLILAVVLLAAPVEARNCPYISPFVHVCTP